MSTTIQLFQTSTPRVTEAGRRPRSLPRRRLSFLLVGLALGLMGGPNGSSAQQVLDERCVITILNRTIQVAPDGSWSVPNVPSNQGQISARATCINDDGTTVSGQSDYFNIVNNGISEPVEIVFDDVSSIPESLDFADPTSLTLSVIGETNQLVVLATYPDQTSEDVSGSENGTNYALTSDGVISVSPDGLVEAIGNGFSLVSARKDGVVAVKRIFVNTGGDLDGDGLPDDYETANGLNPNDPIDAVEDEDGDGLSALAEFNAGTEPFEADTDGDGIEDGEELISGEDGFVSDPLLVDTDGDGLSDSVEVLAGSNPSDANDTNLAAATLSFDVTPSSFTLINNTVTPNGVGQQLSVLATLVDGSLLDLTDTATGTNYASSDLSICNFGIAPGRVFGTAEGSCTITITNAGLSTTASATVIQFTPEPLSVVTIPGYANNVDVDGDYAFVAAGIGGLQVVDVVDRASPSVVADLSTSGTSIDVKVSNGLAYLADGASGLLIADVSLPLAPVETGGVDTPGTAQDLQIQGGFAFIADGVGGLQVVNVSDPNTPTVVGGLLGLGTTTGVDVSGALAVVGSATGVHVVDISDPATPSLVGSVDLNNVKDVVIEGSYAHVANFNDGFAVVDISDPAAPTIVSQAGGFAPRDVAVGGDLAFYAEQLFPNALAIVNVSDPTSATFQGTIDLSSLGDWAHTGIDLDQQHAYITAENFVVGGDFGSTGNTAMMIAQYREITDTAGIAPTVSIVSPATGQEFIQGQILDVLADATDDIFVAAVELLIDGVVVSSDAGPPYNLMHSTLQAGTGTFDFSVRAVDLGGNASETGSRAFSVIPDPLTIASGVVLDELGDPVDGADVSCAGVVGVTEVDGSFTIPDVPTVTNVQCIASAELDGLLAVGASAGVPPIREGTTDVGSFNLIPGFANGNGGFETGDFAGYTVTGGASVIESLGPLTPPEGNFMAFITTGAGAVGNATSTIATDAFFIPEGVQFLTLDFDFLTGEAPGSSFNDTLRVSLQDEATGTEILGQLIGSVQTPGLVGVQGIANLSSHTDFQTVQLDVSGLAGGASACQIVFSIVVQDVGDAVVDSAGLIDNIRFEFPMGSAVTAVGLPVPEPGFGGGLVGGMALLSALGLRRRASPVVRDRDGSRNATETDRQRIRSMKSTRPVLITSLMVLLSFFIAGQSSAQTFPPDVDVNDDGVVNVLDVSLVSSCQGADPLTDEVCSVADVDADGDVDSDDFDAVAASFDQTGYPTCGDGVVNRNEESCDGADAASCGDNGCSSACLCSSLAIEITTPESLLTVGASPIEVSGNVNSGSATLTLNGVVVENAAGSFSGAVDLSEGHNTIVARAVDGTLQTTDSISVSLDLTPPYVTVDSHEDGEEVFTDAVTITGLINDIVRGTIEEDEAQVMVNGVAAAISNRSYSVGDVPLSAGENLITVVGTDQVGNTAVTSVNLTYTVPAGQKVEVASGGGQEAEIGEILPAPISVRVLDDAQAPVAAASVIFRVTQGSGAVAAGMPEEDRAVVVETDANGLASTPFRVGTRSGTANHKVRAQVVGFETEVVFTASATGRTGNKVNINSGNNQRGSVGQILPEPMVVSVTDDGANVVQGARVLFEVTQGGGTLTGGVASLEDVTDSDGRATAELTLGPLSGIDAQRVSATLLDGPPGETINAAFSATAFVPADPGATSITGVVLDNQDNPIPGVTVRVEDSPRQGVSDAEGQFEITEAPVGPVHLIADGSTAAIAGEFPSLSYNLVTVSGAENPLPGPIYMVKLDTENAVFAGPSDVVLELDSYPGFKLEIEADSVTFPDGSTEGLVSVTPVNASKVPMPPPNGMQPQFIVTIQPTNTMFDPPARLTLPNLDGFAPGTQTEMYSFDHDLEEFVAIGLGTVSEDGSVVQSNLGVGVVKAGWHCGSQPGGQGCANGCPICKECDSGCNCNTVEGNGDPRLGSMDTAGDCMAPFCINGSVSQLPDSDDSPADQPCMTCSGAGLTPVPDGSSPDGIASQDTPGDCMKPVCQSGSVGSDVDMADAPDDMCKECSEDGLRDIELSTTTNSLSYSFSPPSESVKKINDALETLESIGVLASVNLLQVTGTLSTQDCCESTMGMSEKQEGSVSGNFGGFSVQARIWPPGPIPTFGPAEVDIFGLASLSATAQFVGGVFLGLSGTVSGQLGFRQDGCSLSTADQGGCAFGNLKTVLTPSLTAEVGGSATIMTDCILCDPETITLSGQLLLGGLSWSLAISDVSYNASSCGSGVSGGLFQPGPGQFQISAMVSGSWTPEGSATQSVNFQKEFLSCTITTSSVTCS